MALNPMPPLPDTPPPFSLWRHVKTGREYQVRTLAWRENDLSVVVVYRLTTDSDVGYKCIENETWCRPLSEFMDGRFERVT
jgi:hypothetical protein